MHCCWPLLFLRFAAFSDNMQWMLARFLSTLPAILLLVLALGSTSTEQREEELEPTTNTPVDGTAGESSICSQLFDSIGPFCQYVIPTEPNGESSGTCQPEFSVETCNNCQDMVRLCGAPDDRDPESICLSDLAPSCAESEIEPLNADFCTVIQRVCSGLSSVESVSGSGSGSGSLGSGVEPTVIPTTGSPPPGSTTTAEPTTTGTPIITTTPTTATGTTSTASIMTTTANDIPTFTTMAPIVLVSLEDLTEEQRGNLVTVRFTGLNEEQFLDSAIATFRMEVAAIVNEFLLNQGQSSKRKKRQAPPVRVFPDDVIVIEPIRVVNGELLVSFVVGGQEGQSAPVSGTDVASLLQAEGPSLATTLSNTSGQPVQFVEAFVTTQTTGVTSDVPTSSQFPTTRATDTTNEELEHQQLQKLSSGAIAGIVISVLIVVLLVVAVVVVAIVALMLGYRNSGGTKLISKRQSKSLPQSYVQVLRHDPDSRLTSEWQAMAGMTEKNEYADLPTTEGKRGTNEHTEL